MVGFGSSLRMSRRRGWEEAYLDYASLRLLLTQIEAVYEEEDWKRVETSSVQNPNDIEGAEGYENEIMFDGGAKGMGENDEEDMGALNITNLSGMLGTMWRKTQRVILGRKSYREHRRNRRRFRRQQQQQRRDNHYQQQQQLDENGDGGEIENYNSYWVITNSDSHPGGNHRRSQHTRDRNNKARKNNENKEANYRALDKGGWRSPGVTDYRDELFLESDDDVAFGYCEDDEEDDDDDWEDEEDWDGDYDEDEDQYYGYGDGYYNNYATLDDSESYDPIEEGKNPPLLDEGNHLPEHYHQGGVSNDHGNIGTKNEEFDCGSPGHDTSNHSSDYFGMSHGILESPTPTPNLQNVYNQEEHRYQKTKKTLSKASYETFLDASARKGDAPSGFNNGSSPSERSWGLLDFLPNLFAKKQTPKPRKSNSLERFLESEQDFLNAASNQSNRETDILSPHRDKKCRISDSPNHYTHFSESYHSSDEPPPPPLPAPSLFHADISSNRLKFRSEPNLSPLFERSETASISCPSEMSVMESSSISFRSSSAMNTGDEVGTAQLSHTNLDSSFNTPLAGKTFKKSHPVSATALGSAMPMTPASPMTPMTPMAPMTPLSPVPEKRTRDMSMDDFNRSVEGFFLNANGFEKDFVGSNGGADTRIGCAGSGGFGVSLKSSVLSPSAATNYIFMPRNHSNDNVTEYLGGDHTGVPESAGLLSPYSSRHQHSPNRDNRLTRKNPSLGKSQFQYLLHNRENLGHMRFPSLSSVTKPTSHSIDNGGNFIMNFLFGRSEVAPDRKPQNNDRIDTSMAQKGVATRGRVSAENLALMGNASSTINRQHRAIDKDKDAKRKRAKTAANRRRRVLLKKQRQLRRQREEFVHLRAAHARASAITERFRGLLRAEVEKVILFANSRLGELSDTIGSLRFQSFDEDQDRKKYPNLADSGMHPASSSDDEEGCDIQSCDSSSSDGNNRRRTADLDDSGRFTKRARAFYSESSNEKEASTRRQIMLRDRLRISRPMFQKADFLGEDFSLLSAVDEADAYTAIGVELMHLLKFVCVNIIGVRRICKKHDHLLANRMLGDYYFRQTKEQNRQVNTGAKKSNQKRGAQHGLFRWSEPQFGGTLSNPISLQDTGGYILGIFDAKIQHIANSTTMQTVSSSLAIALAEFESSQALSSRLGRLDNIAEKEGKETEGVDFPEVPSPRHNVFASTRIREAVTNQISGHCFRGDDDSTVSQECGGIENASTSSNISLTRLQFVVTSVFGLREAARIKAIPFEYYASRLFMTSTGSNILGDGLDGCSRETLDFLCSYNPDSAYTLDADALYSCLLKIRRDHDGIGGVMVASLAAAVKGRSDASNNARFRRQVSAAMSIKPQATGEESTGAPARNIEYKNILRLNTASMLLYSVNYYIITPSAHIYAISLGSRSSLASSLIGAANITSIISSLIHSTLISKPNSFVKKHTDAAIFRLPLIVSALCPFVGNILYSYALAYQSTAMALAGRLLIGFGSAEVLNRQLLLTTVPPESINIEVSRLVKKSMIITAISLFAGALFDIRVKNKTDFAALLDGDGSEGVRPLIHPDAILLTPPTLAMITNTTNVNSSAVQPFLPPLPLNQFTQGMPFGDHSLIPMEYVGYFMSMLWLFQLIGLLFFYDLPTAAKEELDSNVNSDHAKRKRRIDNDEDFDSDSVTSNQASNSGSKYDSTDQGYGSIENNPFITQNISSHGDGTFEKLQTMSRSTVKHRSQHTTTYNESIISVRRLMFSNVAFPTTMALLFLAKVTSEVLLSSCATITSRYFNWSGAWAGFFMGLMSSMILPINISLSAARNFVERNIIKTSLAMARYGLMFMINYEAIFFMIYDIVKGIKKWEISTAYDKFFGVPQYISSYAIVFTSVVFLESVTYTLMSKVSPIRLRKYSIDNVFVVVVVSALGKLAANMVISAVDLSSWIFCNDIINSLCFFLIIAFIVGGYFVRKHYFFLI